jgi:glycerol-3-phosphate responsive antiterminator
MRQSDSVAEVTTVVLGAGDLQHMLKPLVKNKNEKGELVLLHVTFMKGFSNNKLDVKFKEETSDVLHLEPSLVCC